MSQSCSARNLRNPKKHLFSIALSMVFAHHGVMPHKSPTTAEPALREQDVRGLKYFDQLAPLLQRLHDVGCQRDTAGNRQLHYDHYCLLILLFLFNPVVKSLRGLQQASELKNVQRRLGCPRAALGSLSESVTIFDPERLQEIIAELGGQLQPLGHDPRLKDLQHTVTLVDATLLSALPRMAAASLRKTNTGSGLVKWRLHTHFEVDRHIPTRIDVTGAGGGANDERAVLERTVAADRLYVMDRGYAKFTLFNRIAAAGSSYVCRVRDNSAYDVVQERPVSDAGRAARVLTDQLVTMGESSKPQARPAHPLRLVTIQRLPHRKAGHSQRYGGKGSTGPACDGVLRLVTNLLDVPADIIALLYHYRWTIEIFFRFFKQILGCRHLLSHSQNGIEIQTYCAIIACLLISLWTGKKPTLRTYEMICWYFLGIATLEELLAHLEKLKKRDA
jgi:Transposase DDE domain